MKQTHLAFLHPANMYHSPYILEYWSEKRGKEFYGRLLRETQKDEDPVMTYKRLDALNQEAFNDEMYDVYRRFMTWDMDRIREVAAPYANQHYSRLISGEKGWYRIDSSVCPQNYGYNGIKLNVPTANKKVTIEFEGIAGNEGYRSVKTDKAGWRYGFVAYLKNGERVYSDAGYGKSGKLTFKVPANTSYLWLVVMGAPTEHWPVSTGRGRSNNNNQEEQWPYRFRLKGTSPDAAMIIK